MLSKVVRMLLLMAEIQAIKQCMLDRYERYGSFRDPVLQELSEVLDKKLNRLSHSRKKIH